MKEDGAWYRIKNYLWIFSTECNLHTEKWELSISIIKWGYLDFHTYKDARKQEKNQTNILSYPSLLTSVFSFTNKHTHKKYIIKFLN